MLELITLLWWPLIVPLSIVLWARVFGIGLGLLHGVLLIMWSKKE